MKKKSTIIISFSGGRTSAYMAYKMMSEWGGRFDFVTIFANTGLEHPKTLEFVKNCDINYGFNTIWIESVVHHGERIGSTHKVVNFESASRSGEPFIEVVKKYGLPNLGFLHCTRELKLNPIKSLLKSIGKSDSKVALGIRADEPRRVKNTDFKIIYPLAHDWPMKKAQVLSFWSKQEFDLGIEEFEGNCQGCFKKSIVKQFLQISKDRSVYDLILKLEETHEKHFTGTSKKREWFRENNTTKDLLKLHETISGSEQREFIFDYFAKDDGGCGESCEVFEMF